MSSEQDEISNTLVRLGLGEGSKVERIKVISDYLHGHLVQELQASSPRFNEDQVQLIEFHGIYQQEDRDSRQTRKAERVEKAYQFMIRSRIPGGAITADQYLVQDDLSNRMEMARCVSQHGRDFSCMEYSKAIFDTTIHTINASLLSTLAACGDVNRNVMACPGSYCQSCPGSSTGDRGELAMHLHQKQSLS